MSGNADPAQAAPGLASERKADAAADPAKPEKQEAPRIDSKQEARPASGTEAPRGKQQIPAGEVAVKWIGAFVGVATILWSIVSYRETARREFAKPYYERQSKLYFDISETAARLATSTDRDVRKQAWDRFWELYWGNMCLVEDRQVEARMIAFGDQLRAYDDSPTREDLPMLQQKSFDLAHALRQSLSSTWPVPSDPIPMRARRPAGSRDAPPGIGGF